MAGCFAEELAASSVFLRLSAGAATFVDSSKQAVKKQLD
jgi:hypothetical protein